MATATLQLHPELQSKFPLDAIPAFSEIAQSSWSRLLKSPWSCLEGLFWGTTCSFGMYECYESVRALRCYSFHDLRSRENCEKLQGQIKATVHAVFGLFGYSTSLLEWADRMRLITLGNLIPLVQKISYLALFVNAGFGVDKCLQAIKKKKCAILSEVDPVERSAHEHQYRSALLDLASHISSIAWALIGLVKLCFAVAASPVLANAVLMVSCVFALVSFSYGIYVSVKFDPQQQEPG